MAHATRRIDRQGRSRAVRILYLPERPLVLLRRFARGWALAASALFLGLIAVRGVPRHPELGQWQELAQIALVVLLALGSLLALRWVALGAMILAFGSVFLGVLATTQYDPRWSLFACLAFLVPAVLLWLTWQHMRSLATIFGLALALALLLAGGGVAAGRLYDHLFGPTHPVSATTLPDAEHVAWIWAGAVTTESARVIAKLEHDAVVRLAWGRSADLSDATLTDPQQAAASLNARVVGFALTGLAPDTRYYYAVVGDGWFERARTGTLRTFPAGPASFTIAVGSCARVGSNGRVFDAIRAQEPLLYLNDGDLHYSYIGGDDPGRFRAALDAALREPAQQALYLAAPIAYIWDDHDYGPNDGDGSSPTRAAAGTVYRQYVPHYPLLDGVDGPIAQAFTIGRVRVIMTDLRSARTPNSAPDDARKSMLGAEQKAWFKQQLLDANGHYPLIIWVSSVPWIADVEPGADHWGGFSTERREIADFIAENEIHGLLMLAGDAHMLAIDDGSHADYSTHGGGGFPVFHAAALDQHGSVKGGPYSEVAYPGSGQFGLVTVQDTGARVTVTLSGRDYTGAEVVSYTFSVGE